MIEENKTKDTEQKKPDSGKLDPEIITVIESNIYELVDKYINSLEDPEQLKENNGLFVDMLKYIYKYYVSTLLDNKYNVNNRYDYKVLDELFNIYTELVYKYKKNKQPNIVEFTIFVNVCRESLYNIRYGQVKKATPADVQNVKRWFNECENSLLNNDSVASIFKLKAMFHYNDNLAPIPIENQGAALGVNELPDLNIQKIAKSGTPRQITEKKKNP